MIRYTIYRHPQDIENELLDTIETAYPISEGQTVVGTKGVPMVVKKVVVKVDSVDLYAASVLGFAGDSFFDS